MEDSYLGVIEALGFQFAPRNWAYCAGALIAIAQSQALFSLLGDRFGGDARVTFGLPDLRGRTPMGQFQGPGLTDRILGQKPGAEYITLTTSHLPTHTHSHSYAGGGGGGIPASLSASATAAKKQTPADGDFIAPAANNFGALQDNMFIAPADITSTVELGGVTGGGGGFDPNLFAIHDTGLSTPFSIVQPSQTVNFCICIQGLFPSRS
ncbi:phage tail protein [Kordiimonas sp.]|uniref:phage tail protein n=1 Tax=Kordiimonas sp. TaxID=1970157 RepID=UPI003A92FDA6